MNNRKKNSLKKSFVLQLNRNKDEHAPLKICFNKCSQPLEFTYLPDISTIQFGTAEPQRKPIWIPPPAKTTKVPSPPIKIVRRNNAEKKAEDYGIVIERANNYCCPSNHRCQQTFFDPTPKTGVTYTESQTFFNKSRDFTCGNCQWKKNYMPEPLHYKDIFVSSEKRLPCVCKKAFPNFNNYLLPMQIPKIEQKNEFVCVHQNPPYPGHLVVHNNHYYLPLSTFAATEDKETSTNGLNADSKSKITVIDSNRNNSIINEEARKRFEADEQDSNIPELEDAVDEDLGLMSKVIEMLNKQNGKFEESCECSKRNTEATDNLVTYAKRIDDNLNSLRLEIMNALEDISASVREMPRDLTRATDKGREIQEKNKPKELKTLPSGSKVKQGNTKLGSLFKNKKPAT